MIIQRGAQLIASSVVLYLFCCCFESAQGIAETSLERIYNDTTWSVVPNRRVALLFHNTDETKRGAYRRCGTQWSGNPNRDSETRAEALSHTIWAANDQFNKKRGYLSQDPTLDQCKKYCLDINLNVCTGWQSGTTVHMEACTGAGVPQSNCTGKRQPPFADTGCVTSPYNLPPTSDPGIDVLAESPQHGAFCAGFNWKHDGTGCYFFDNRPYLGQPAPATHVAVKNCSDITATNTLAHDDGNTALDIYFLNLDSLPASLKNAYDTGYEHFGMYNHASLQTSNLQCIKSSEVGDSYKSTYRPDDASVYFQASRLKVDVDPSNQPFDADHNDLNATTVYSTPHIVVDDAVQGTPAKFSCINDLGMPKCPSLDPNYPTQYKDDEYGCDANRDYGPDTGRSANGITMDEYKAKLADYYVAYGNFGPTPKLPNASDTSWHPRVPKWQTGKASIEGYADDTNFGELNYPPGCTSLKSAGFQGDIRLPDLSATKTPVPDVNLVCNKNMGCKSGHAFDFGYYGVSQWNEQKNRSLYPLHARYRKTAFDAGTTYTNDEDVDRHLTGPDIEMCLNWANELDWLESTGFYTYDNDLKGPKAGNTQNNFVAARSWRSKVTVEDVVNFDYFDDLIDDNIVCGGEWCVDKYGHRVQRNPWIGQVITWHACELMYCAMHPHIGRTAGDGDTKRDYSEDFVEVATSRRRLSQTTEDTKVEAFTSWFQSGSYAGWEYPNEPKYLLDKTNVLGNAYHSSNYDSSSWLLQFDDADESTLPQNPDFSWNKDSSTWNDFEPNYGGITDSSGRYFQSAFAFKKTRTFNAESSDFIINPFRQVEWSTVVETDLLAGIFPNTTTRPDWNPVAETNPTWYDQYCAQPEIDCDVPTSTSRRLAEQPNQVVALPHRRLGHVADYCIEKTYVEQTREIDVGSASNVQTDNCHIVRHKYENWYFHEGTKTSVTNYTRTKWVQNSGSDNVPFYSTVVESCDDSVADRTTECAYFNDNDDVNFPYTDYGAPTVARKCQHACNCYNNVDAAETCIGWQSHASWSGPIRFCELFILYEASSGCDFVDISKLIQLKTSIAEFDSTTAAYAVHIDDDDHDGVYNDEDNCRYVYNPDQHDVCTWNTNGDETTTFYHDSYLKFDVSPKGPFHFSKALQEDDFMSGFFFLSKPNDADIGSALDVDNAVKCGFRDTSQLWYDEETTLIDKSDINFMEYTNPAVANIFSWEKCTSETQPKFSMPHITAAYEQKASGDSQNAFEQCINVRKDSSLTGNEAHYREFWDVQASLIMCKETRQSVWNFNNLYTDSVEIDANSVVSSFNTKPLHSALTNNTIKCEQSERVYQAWQGEVKNSDGHCMDLVFYKTLASRTDEAKVPLQDLLKATISAGETETFYGYAQHPVHGNVTGFGCNDIYAVFMDGLSAQQHNMSLCLLCTTLTDSRERGPNFETPYTALDSCCICAVACAAKQTYPLSHDIDVSVVPTARSYQTDAKDTTLFPKGIMHYWWNWHRTNPNTVVANPTFYSQIDPDHFLFDLPANHTSSPFEAELNDNLNVFHHTFMKYYYGDDTTAAFDAQRWDQSQCKLFTQKLTLGPVRFKATADSSPSSTDYLFQDSGYDMTFILYNVVAPTSAPTPAPTLAPTLLTPPPTEPPTKSPTEDDECSYCFPLGTCLCLPPIIPPLPPLPPVIPCVTKWYPWCKPKCSPPKNPCCDLKTGISMIDRAADLWDAGKCLWTITKCSTKSYHACKKKHAHDDTKINTFECNMACNPNVCAAASNNTLVDSDGKDWQGIGATDPITNVENPFWNDCVKASPNSEACESLQYHEIFGGAETDPSARPEHFMGFDDDYEYCLSEMAQCLVAEDFYENCFADDEDKDEIDKCGLPGMGFCFQDAIEHCLVQQSHSLVFGYDRLDKSCAAFTVERLADGTACIPATEEQLKPYTSNCTHLLADGSERTEPCYRPPHLKLREECDALYEFDPNFDEAALKRDGTEDDMWECLYKEVMSGCACALDCECTAERAEYDFWTDEYNIGPDQCHDPPPDPPGCGPDDPTPPPSAETTCHTWAPTLATASPTLAPHAVGTQAPVSDGIIIDTPTSPPSPPETVTIQFTTGHLHMYSCYHAPRDNDHQYGSASMNPFPQSGQAINGGGNYAGAWKHTDCLTGVSAYPNDPDGGTWTWTTQYADPTCGFEAEGTCYWYEPNKLDKYSNGDRYYYQFDIATSGSCADLSDATKGTCQNINEATCNWLQYHNVFNALRCCDDESPTKTCSLESEFSASGICVAKTPIDKSTFPSGCSFKTATPNNNTFFYNDFDTEIEFTSARNGYCVCDYNNPDPQLLATADKSTVHRSFYDTSSLYITAFQYGSGTDRVYESQNARNYHINPIYLDNPFRFWFNFSDSGDAEHADVVYNNIKNDVWQYRIKDVEIKILKVTEDSTNSYTVVGSYQNKYDVYGDLQTCEGRTDGQWARIDTSEKCFEAFDHVTYPHLHSDNKNIVSSDQLPCGCLLSLKVAGKVYFNDHVNCTNSCGATHNDNGDSSACICEASSAQTQTVRVEQRFCGKDVGQKLSANGDYDGKRVDDVTQFIEGYIDTNYPYVGHHYNVPCVELDQPTTHPYTSTNVLREHIQRVIDDEFDATNEYTVQRVQELINTNFWIVGELSNIADSSTCSTYGSKCYLGLRFKMELVENDSGGRRRLLFAKTYDEIVGEIVQPSHRQLQEQEYAADPVASPTTSPTASASPTAATTPPTIGFETAVSESLQLPTFLPTILTVDAQCSNPKYLRELWYCMQDWLVHPTDIYSINVTFYVDQNNSLIRIGTNTISEAFVARRLKDTCLDSLSALCVATVVDTTTTTTTEVKEVKESVETLTIAISIALPVCFLALCCMFMCNARPFHYTQRLDDDDSKQRPIVIHNTINNNSDTIGPRNNRSTRNYNSNNRIDDHSSRSYSYNDGMEYETEFGVHELDDTACGEEQPFLGSGDSLKISSVKRMRFRKR